MVEEEPPTYTEATTKSEDSTYSSDTTSSVKASPNSGDDRRGRQMTRDIVNPLSVDNLRKRGYHTLRSSFKPFHVENRWRLVRELGQGAYGMVISAEDKISGETVAIKMVTRIFDKLQLAKRALREVTLLRHFSTRGHENITGLIDLDAIHPDYTEMSGQNLTSEHIQYFLYQILRGMKYIHSASVIHRDLKPGNLLVNSDCELKVCDFGLANTYEGEATRWYRAPEIMLSFRTYSTASESIGCILAELLLGKPLFRGKDSYVDQLNRILDILGTPDEAVFDKICSEKAKAYMRSLPIRKRQPFVKVFPTADAQVIDLLSKMITWNPDTRITVIEALSHPWLAGYHDPNDEPACPTKYDRYKDYEKLTTLEEFRTAIWSEIQDFRKEPVQDEKEAATLTLSPDRSTFIISPEEEERVLPPPQQESIPEDVEPASGSGAEDKQPDFDDLPPPVRRDQSTLVASTDPIVSYRRRSSILQSSNANSPHMPSRGSGHFSHQSFPSYGQNDSTNEGSYIVPARSRAASMLGGGQSQLLRTLSTFSIYEQVDGEAGKLIAARETAADAPPSSIPQEFVTTDKD
ncbi:kinase-like protein [Hysterangium stoloniferum]|nr:kinase-like protein [Hysterangium stoloniferum]